MKAHQSLPTERDGLCKTDTLRHSLQRNSGELAREPTARFPLQSRAVTPCSCEEQTSRRAQEETRAAAHAADSIPQGLESDQRLRTQNNALRSIFNILDSLYTTLGALSERWRYLGGQVKQSSAQKELASLASEIHGRCSLLWTEREKEEPLGKAAWNGRVRSTGLTNTLHEKQRCWYCQGDGSVIPTLSRQSQKSERWACCH